MNTKINICGITVTACLVMAFIDGVWQPGYRIKAAFKILMFAIIPAVYCVVDKKCDIKKCLVWGKNNRKIIIMMAVGVYLLIVSVCFIGKNFVDFSMVADALKKSQGVDKSNFIVTRIYISFVNSWLEEFFFRGFAYFSLKPVIGRNFSFVFSALCFAMYHIAILDGWFHPVVTVLIIAALVFAGGLFNFIDEISDSIFASWFVHMAANFAINTVGLFVLGIV